MKQEVEDNKTHAPSRHRESQTQILEIFAYEQLLLLHIDRRNLHITLRTRQETGWGAEKLPLMRATVYRKEQRNQPTPVYGVFCWWFPEL